MKRIIKTLLIIVLVLSFAIIDVAPAAAGTKYDYYLKINKSTNVVTVYDMKDKPVTAFVCSTGAATPLGTFYTMDKHRWWTLDGPCYGQYCTRITAHVLFHSVWYRVNEDPRTQAFSQYNKLGTSASHGCTRLTTAASKWIYDTCPTGTKVIIFAGTEADDPLGKPQFIHVEGYQGWDPTDPNPENNSVYKDSKPVIKVNKKKTTLKVGDKFNLNGVTCIDSMGVKINNYIRYTGSVNTKKAGKYQVVYSVLDSFGRKATKTVTYTVKDSDSPVISNVKKEINKTLDQKRNMLNNVTARDVNGKDITDYIKVYYKEPGEDEYYPLDGDVLTFDFVGTYKIKYVVKSRKNNEKAVAYMKVNVSKPAKVKKTKKQVIKIEDGKSGKSSEALITIEE
ncbi:MAG: DUF5011 domain-containing protein [Lachnospiraceae bacterium]|nr:DUF5011 domain-containing protein [Lachnospiraceae bacterium]